MGNVPAGGFRRFRFQLTKSGSQQPSGRFAVILTVFRVAGAKLAQRLVDLSLDKVRPVSQRGGVWRLSEDDCVPHRHTTQLPHMTQAEAPRHFPDLRHDSHIHVFLFPRASQQVHDLLTTGPQIARPHAHELPLPLRRVPPRLLAPSLAPSRAPSATLRSGLATPQARVQLFAERFERRVALGCSFRLGVIISTVATARPRSVRVRACLYVQHGGARGRAWFRFRVRVRVSQLRRRPRQRGSGS